MFLNFTEQVFIIQILGTSIYNELWKINHCSTFKDFTIQHGDNYSNWAEYHVNSTVEANITMGTQRKAQIAQPQQDSMVCFGLSYFKG